MLKRRLEEISEGIPDEQAEFTQLQEELVQFID